MRHRCPAILFAVLLLAPATTFSQKRACPVPPPSPFKHIGEIATRLDKSTDSMRTTLEYPRPLVRGADTLYLSAAFTHHDPHQSVAPTLELSFISHSAVEKFRDSHEVALLLDGTLRSFAGKTIYQSRSKGGGSIEAAKIRLSFHDLQDMVRARRVVARLGTKEFELSHEHLEALREMASLMAPSSNRWRVS
jgi:hypothetical protein